MKSGPFFSRQPNRPSIPRRPFGLLALALALSMTVGPAHEPAWGQSADELSAYEQQIFSYTYNDEPLARRLARLEEKVFGAAQSGSESHRFNRLIGVLGKAQRVIPGSAPATDNTAGETPGFRPFSAPQQAPPPKPADATDYPTVTALEREVFGRDFIREDIGNRLARLEKKVFGQPYPNVALVDRVDKLLMRYPNVTTGYPPGSGDYPDSAIRDLPSDASQFRGSSRDVYTKVDALERRILNAPAQPNDLLTTRLDRLEQRVYGRSFGGESIDNRVDRLMRQYDASGGNHQARPAVQNRPGFQHPSGSYSTAATPPANAYQAGNAPPPRQNIQIGAGMSSTSTYRFSPEMMRMLPPDVRQQLSGGASGGTVVSSPGTVVIEQSTYGVPGFQTYGPQGIPYYNYYGGMQNRTTTTVIQPDGSGSVHQNVAPMPFPGNPNGLPNPAYIGDPGFLQALGNLEINVFGQVNTMEPPYVRLGKLESAVLGQVYPSYPEQQRLNYLQQAYQYQSLGRIFGKGKAGDIGRTAGSLILGVPLNQPAQPQMPGVTLPP